MKHCEFCTPDRQEVIPLGFGTLLQPAGWMAPAVRPSGSEAGQGMAELSPAPAPAAASPSHAPRAQRPMASVWLTKRKSFE